MLVFPPAVRSRNAAVQAQARPHGGLSLDGSETSSFAGSSGGHRFGMQVLFILFFTLKINPFTAFV